MTRSHRNHRPLPRPASTLGQAEPHSRQAEGQRPHPASRPDRDGFTGWLIQGIAAAANVAAGRNWAAPAATMSRRTITAPRLSPHTVQLCIHCHQNPAGFWVSRTAAQIVRRPWCLSCCQHLDPGRYHAIPFEHPGEAGQFQ